MGSQTARALRADCGMAGVRLVALTGRGTWDIRESALRAGFDDFLDLLNLEDDSSRDYSLYGSSRALPGRSRPLFQDASHVRHVL